MSLTWFYHVSQQVSTHVHGQGIVPIEEFETCSFDGRNYTFDCSKLYKAEWRQAFQTRLGLILVCKLWSDLASEYLYRSILVASDYTAQEFVQLVPRLINNGMIRHVQRVSVHSPHDVLAHGPPLLDAIAQIHNLHVLQICPYVALGREMNQAHITTLDVRVDGWSAFETLASLPHLQCLRFSLVTYMPVSSRVKLSQVKTLYVEAYNHFHSFYEWLDVPNLHTLIVPRTCTTYRFPLIQHFLPRVRTLEFQDLDAQLPLNDHPAPYLRSVICRHPFGTNWRDLPLVAPLRAVEEVHIWLETPVIRRLLYPPYYYDSHIASILAHTVDEKVMENLSYIYTDLTTNTLRIMKSGLKDELREWLTNMKKHGITVMTYIKTSKYADRKYCTLEAVWDAEPHWEFWEPIGDVYERRKWDLLAEATGRENMTWRVTKDCSECQWFRKAKGQRQIHSQLPNVAS